MSYNPLYGNRHNSPLSISACIEARAGWLVEWVRNMGGWDLELVRRPSGQHTFEILPRRWVVERTFAWLGRYRRLSKDYEELPQTTEAWVYTAMTGLMLRRLAHFNAF